MHSGLVIRSCDSYRLQVKSEATVFVGILRPEEEVCVHWHLARGLGALLGRRAKAQLGLVCSVVCVVWSEGQH